jgi:hypothetical protein
MSTATDDPDAGQPEGTQEPAPSQPKARRTDKARWAVKFGWGLYEQVKWVFGVIGAVGLAALLNQWWHIGWRGWLKALVGIWSHTVRPAITWVFHVLVTVPLGWIGVHFEVPLVLRDYFSIGVICALSTFRVWKKETDRAWLFPLHAVREYRATSYGSHQSFMAGGLVGSVTASPAALLVVWPLRILASLVLVLVAAPILAVALAHGRFDRPNQTSELDRRLMAQTLIRNLPRELRIQAPVVYLGVLLAINFWVLH